MDKETQLRNAVREARELAQSTARWHTRADIEALLDMAEQAEKALRGEMRPPHSGSRGFMETQNREEQISFALSRYTMAPTYLEQGAWTRYGLCEAIRWFRGRDMRAGEDASREERAKEILLRCREILESGAFGALPGQYDPSSREALFKSSRALAAELESGRDAEGLAARLKEAQDALYDALLSRHGRSDEGGLLLISREELLRLKRAVKEDEAAKRQYEKIREKADGLSLEEVKKRYGYLFAPPSYDVLNREYFLWQKTSANINFTVPEGTTYGILSFVLPGEENEREGLGHVWIDDVRLHAAAGTFSFPKNGGFEELKEGGDEPKLWRRSALKGDPCLEVESSYPFCGSGAHSIFLKNPDRDCEGAWECEEKIPFRAGESYTLGFSAKIDGKFRRGVLARIVFYGADETEKGSFCHAFNWKAWIPCGDYNLRMQCDAICGALTGKREYAEKAKYEILHFMDDFIQGAEHWLRTNARPEGSDAYGAVQGGRDLCSIACSYALIAEQEVFSREEKERFFAMLDYFLRYMTDRRDRSMLPYREAQHGCSNWQLDMCIGVVMAMLAVPDYPDRKKWMISACRVIRGLLECNVSRDGSWPESLRYHHAALERLAQFARAVRNEWDEDWFADELLKGMFRYSAAVQTPPYRYFGGHIATPPFGDHALSDGAEYACHGLYCPLVAEKDPKLAAVMYDAWRNAGKPVKRLWGESLALENLLYAGERSAGETKPLVSDASHPDSGIYLFRTGGGREGYCAVMSSPKPIGHGHLDQGAFLIYRDGIPVVMDGGIEGYFDVSTQWHISSYSHAVMQFEAPPLDGEEERGEINLSAGTYSRKRGWDDLPRTSRVKECVLGEREEYLKMEIENIRGNGVQTRTVYHQRERDFYIIRDEVRGFAGRILFSLPTVMHENRVQGQTVTGDGYYGMKLQTIFLGKVNAIRIGTGRCTPFFPHGEELPELSYIRAEAEAEDGFLAILSPGKQLHIKTASVSGDCLVRISFDDGTEEEIRLP